MMNNLQYLLIKLAEESAEIAKIALKTSQFGIHSQINGDAVNNFQMTHNELNDLLAIVEMLNTECNFGYIPNEEAIAKKKAKVAYYRNISGQLGHVHNVVWYTRSKD